MRYRKKPVVIDAEQFTVGNADKVLFDFCKEAQGMYFDKANESYYIIISTLEGNMRADEGDYIIKGVNGEFYPCKPDVFAKTYETADAPTIEPVRGEWVSVKDRLPEDNSVVLAYCVGTARNGNCSLVASCDKGFWFLQNSQARLGFPNLQYVVTHWMPLPDAPKEDDA